MTPKEKAEKLFDMFYDATDEHWDRMSVTKKCALIAVDEIINVCKMREIRESAYWQQVKNEIEKL